MKLGFAFAADAAEPSTDGRFSAIGAATDGYLLPTLPVVVASLSLVAQISFEPEECGQTYRLEVRVRSSDGSEVPVGKPAELTATLDPHFPSRRSNTIAIVKMTGWVIEQQGIYYFDFYIGGTRIGSLEFGVVVIDNALRAT